MNLKLSVGIICIFAFQIVCSFGINPITYLNNIDLEYDVVTQEPTNSAGPYLPNWPSLDSRSLPKWYDESKIGIFIHLGVFSVPGLSDAWFWKFWKEGRKDLVSFMKNNYKPDFTYQDFASQFTAEFFDPNEWAELFKKSGAKYVVLTSKHHDGFTLYPSATGFGWNSNDVGPHRDIVGELASAIRNNTDLHFGLYHSLLEWYNPLYMNDQKNQLKTNDFVNFKTMPELYEIVNKYRPEVIWSDGNWEAADTYWQSTKFLAWLYNKSPVKDIVVTNDRWGNNTSCKHGGFYSCEDRYNPKTLQPHKWENAFTLDKFSWGIRRNAKFEDYLTPEELISTIVETVSCGGNVLVNVGPTASGVIIPIQQERLMQMGEWLGINQEAIFDSVPWIYQNDTVTPNVWYTSNPHKSKVYAIMTKWPENCDDSIVLTNLDASRISKATILGYNGTLPFSASKTGTKVVLPEQRKINSKWAWTIAFQIL